MNATKEKALSALGQASVLAQWIASVNDSGANRAISFIMEFLSAAEKVLPSEEKK